MNAATEINKLIRLPELMKITGLSRSSIYLRLNQKSPYFDKFFPKPIRLSSSGIRGAVAWLLSEIQEWIQLRLESSRT